jgi:hypothetical protein
VPTGIRNTRAPLPQYRAIPFGIGHNCPSLLRPQAPLLPVRDTSFPDTSAAAAVTLPLFLTGGAPSLLRRDRRLDAPPFPSSSWPAPVPAPSRPFPSSSRWAPSVLRRSRWRGTPLPFFHHGRPLLKGGLDGSPLRRPAPTPSAPPPT